MAGIVVDIEAISSNITLLNTLFDELESGVQTVNRVVGQQTSDVWTDIPTCAQFARTYQNTLQVLYTRLTDAWNKISAQAHALAEATRGFVSTDEDSARANSALAFRLDALLVRAEQGPSKLDIAGIAQDVAVAAALPGTGAGSALDAMTSAANRVVDVATAVSISGGTPTEG